jgi:hypothetical protein
MRGRREGVEDAIGGGTSDSIPECELALTNSLGGTAVLKPPPETLDRRVGPCQED